MERIILFFKGACFKLMPTVFSILHFLDTYYDTLILGALVSIFLSIVMGLMVRPRIKLKTCLCLIVFLVVPFTTLGVYLYPESDTFKKSYNMYIDHYDDIKSSINHICELQADMEYNQKKMNTYYSDAMRYKENTEVSQYEEDVAIYTSIIASYNSVVVRNRNIQNSVEAELFELNTLVTQIGYKAFSLDSLKYFSD